jgi:hypothetical protein
MEGQCYNSVTLILCQVWMTIHYLIGWNNYPHPHQHLTVTHAVTNHRPSEHSHHCSTTLYEAQGKVECRCKKDFPYMQKAPKNILKGAQEVL